MGTIFVAFGGSEHRNTVLEFAVEQAAVSGHDLFVYHVQESEDESVEQIRDEIETVIQRTAPDVTFEVKIQGRGEFSDRTNIAEEKLLTDAILESDRDYEYVVMGDREHNFVDELLHPSMIETVLKTHAIPVMLVPV
ncbi:universal stress protein [Halorussus limi]|uniref:Universal stress protein n=1 Tax=Halorussus limi TaxID=2938695 RepID=A0A8U0HQQ7_9EURY|nr:universal stress protein [Halorussus limi]UPV73209.1 universal stress protein [Halorussus limi]